MANRELTPKRAASETRARVKRELKETRAIASSMFRRSHEMLKAMERDFMALLDYDVLFVGKMRAREKKRQGGL